MRVLGRRYLAITLLAWFAFLAVDFFVHAGLLEERYERGGPGLLPLDLAFARIPAGYLSFLLLVGLVVWLGIRFEVSGARDGVALGLSVGVPLAAAHGLGLFSITTIDPVVLAWWSAAEAAEIAVAGAVTGSALASARIGRVVLFVAVAVIASFVATIALQNL